MFNSMAQDKVLTMEEAILGYNLHPKNMFVQWKADQNVLTYIEGTNLVGENAADGKKEVLLNLEDLNRILKTALRGFPQFSWKDANNIIIARQGKIFAIDVVKKEISQGIGGLY